jgi:hypothetical protein
MARMWRGPCAALKAAESDPLWSALHRRNGKLGVFCNVSSDGRLAQFHTITKHRGEWYQNDLGEAQGRDPFLTVLRGSHRFTPLDAELLDLHSRYLERLADEIAGDLHAVVTKLGRAVDAYCE